MCYCVVLLFCFDLLVVFGFVIAGVLFVCLFGFEVFVLMLLGFALAWLVVALC